MAKVKQVRGKKRAKKNIAKGVAHVHSTFNNTIVTITDAVSYTHLDVYKRQIKNCKPSC